MMMPTLAAFLQVILIDLALAADNALIIGAIVAGLEPRRQRVALGVGIAVAIAARLGFAFAAAWLLGISWVAVAGGAVLLWIAWKLGRDILGQSGEEAHAPRDHPTLAHAIAAVVAADVAMSLDNILGVAAVARGAPAAMAAGVALSMLLMAAGAAWLAGQMARHRWLAWLAVATIVVAGVRLIWGGLGLPAIT